MRGRAGRRATGAAGAVDGDGAAAVVLAMPQPQAADLLPSRRPTRLGLEPGLEWDRHADRWAAGGERWCDADPEGAFVRRVARRRPDPGRRPPPGRRRAGARRPQHARVTPRGGWTTRDAGVAGVLEEVGRLLGDARPPPLFARARRWSLAVAVRPGQERPSALDDETGSRVCGDGWGRKSAGRASLAVRGRARPRTRRPAEKPRRGAEPRPITLRLASTTTGRQADARDRARRSPVGRRGQGQGDRPARASGVDYVVKFNGGNNAGHTVVVGRREVRPAPAALRHPHPRLRAGDRQRRRRRPRRALRGDRRARRRAASTRRKLLVSRQRARHHAATTGPSTR